jgi:hypothetical protein
MLNKPLEGIAALHSPTSSPHWRFPKYEVWNRDCGIAQMQLRALPSEMLWTRTVEVKSKLLELA